MFADRSLDVHARCVLKQARELLSRMMELRMRPNTQCFNAVIKALAEDGQINEVKKVLMTSVVQVNTKE